MRTIKRFGNWSILCKIMSISAITLVLMLLTILFYFLPTVERRLVDSKKEELEPSVPI